MKPALLLVDIQSDFLEREGLVPRPDVLIRQVARLVDGCRALNIPVLHVHTQVRSDGSDRMPHWKRADTYLCVEGTAGVLPPETLRPAADERRFTKRFYSAFGEPSLAAALNELGIDTLVIAGIYLHGCVRSTVLDAYERGYEVWIADDAVGSSEPDHAELTRAYLKGRAAEFIPTDALLSRLGARESGLCTAEVIPAACIGGRRVNREARQYIERRNPSNWSEITACISVAGVIEVNDAGGAAAAALGPWRETAAAQRAALLDAWANALRRRWRELAGLLALEIGKPVADGRAEINKAVEFIRAAAGLSRQGQTTRIVGAPVRVRHRPRGVIGLITPWNNPIAIPAGKIAPALAWGNAVVWKPAVESPRTALALMESLRDAGIDPALVNLVFGDAPTARLLIEHPMVDAISLTGSIETGRATAALCSRLGKPLQAELGGNNAAIILSGCDLRREAHALALSAFSFGGQRCTSIQRFVVERAVLREFETEFVAAVEALVLGDPLDAATHVGPLISRHHRQWIRSIIERAPAGAHVYCGGDIPRGLEAGCWLRPAVVGRVSPQSVIAREEIFGPVAVILPADDLDQAVRIANGVRHGLVAAVHGGGKIQRQRFAAAAAAGILKFSPGALDVHPLAPFGGWKASGVGPPEHGVWDRQFYTRPQAVYGWDGEPAEG